MYTTVVLRLFLVSLFQIYSKVRIKPCFTLTSSKWISVISVFSVFQSGSTIPTMDIRKKGYHKMYNLDINTRQRVVVEFLTGEKIPPEEIFKRMEKIYGNDTIDINRIRSWANRPGESDFRLEGRLMQRAVIQFLTAEGVRPLEIYWRLVEVYKTVPYSRCSIWRWAVRYMDGNEDVGDKVRQGRPAVKLRYVRNSTTTGNLTTR